MSGRIRVSPSGNFTPAWTKAIKNRDNFLVHIMDKFPFEETADAGVYYDKELKAEMAVAGNEVSFKFRENGEHK